ncbi:penicillin-binding protein 1B [Agaribacter marinus]|uniref:penicillin-binding protein 1B n=1 Tax=Agaribacter marinus TaxID=1431249 RepID=UPI0024E0642C|nr:penicillin-binding protein 1B [Agaribacter marinus]
MKIIQILTAPFRWFKKHFFKLALVIIVLIGSYLFYIDAQIKERFAGNKWEVPAQVYARPLVLTLQQEITPHEVEDELTLLGYRKVNKVKQVGEYTITQHSVKIYRRAFEYIALDAPERMVEIEWQNKRIHQIRLPHTKQQSRRIMLEPWLVSRLVGGLDEDRMLLLDEDIPEMLKVALLAVEDKDFYEHHGIAPLGIIRALFANLSAGRTVQGGSTLTQQLVKNLYLTRERSYIRKIREAAMAVVIDFRYTKQEILNAYINEVFLGQNGAVAVHGFGLASHFYFNKPLSELALDEIATLVGMVKGPSYYHPVRHKARAQERRNLVLRVLFEGKHLDLQEYQAALVKPLKTASSSSLASGKHPAFMDKVRQEIDEVIAAPELKQSGIKLYTTLDINVQRRAEAAVKKVIKAKQNKKLPDLDAAMVVTDIDSGGIRAIVGGKNTDYAGFNRALNASRPIGSLIKPVVFLSALTEPERFNLATQLEDKPISLDDAGGKRWKPLNADKAFRGHVPLIDALVHSYNVPTVNLALALGLDKVVDILNDLGADKRPTLLPSIALGAIELTPLSVNQVYQTIANKGEFRPLHSLSAVSTHDNKVIWRREDVYEQVVNEDASYLLNYALNKVTRVGTAKRLSEQFPSVNMAGKTGTTDDYRDSWFAGFDRHLVTSVWLGNDENKPIYMSGASGALVIFSEFQKQQTPKNLSQRFPSSLMIAHFNAGTGELTTPGCGDVLSVPAIKQFLPIRAKCNNKITEAPLPQTKKPKTWWQKLFGN